MNAEKITSSKTECEVSSGGEKSFRQIRAVYDDEVIRVYQAYSKKLEEGPDCETQKMSAPVRVQWDPERDMQLRPLPYRSIQIGLSKEAVSLYVNEWIKNISDVTSLAHSLCELVKQGDFAQAELLLPSERPYPVSRALEMKLGMLDKPLC